ncbi:MAG: hypothetical protein JXA99_04175 [Candidatus Lokiarchaeota archaeon]|nr:hypothetical protein [Candidatus Lokiarchaeota archaeon]
MKKNCITIHLLFFLSIPILIGQSIPVRITNDVYSFLDRQAIIGHLEYFPSESRPLSRMKIAYYLNILLEKENELSKFSQDELMWYLKEYYDELKRIRIDDKISDVNERFYLVDLEEGDFFLKVNPLGGYGLNIVGDANGHTQIIGARISGEYSDNFSGYFEYKDKGEFGKNFDRDKIFSKETGHFIKNAPNGIEYSDVIGGLLYDFGWGKVGIIKEYNIWGHNNSSSLFLSTKAASYPQIILELYPVPWLRFYYIHGWLNSLVIDSSASYYDYQSEIEPRIKEKYHDKYIAANFLTINYFPKLIISLGNAFIYSGSLRPEMFIPFMYYKVMDHNTGRGAVDDGNGQIFFDVSTTYLNNTRIYAGLLIDVLEVRELLDGEFYKSWFGYNFGIRYAGFFDGRLDLYAEYVRTDPWLYENKYQTTNYKHLNYSLGHWIGRNADLFSIGATYRFLPNLKANLHFERARQGGMNDIYYAYKERAKLPFLFGELRKDFKIKLEAFYQPIHDLFIRAYYEYSDITDESTDRTPQFMLGSNHSFGLFVSYGITL